MTDRRRGSLGALLGMGEQKKEPQRSGGVRRRSGDAEAEKEGSIFGIPKYVSFQINYFNV